MLADDRSNYRFVCHLERIEDGWRSSEQMVDKQAQLAMVSSHLWFVFEAVEVYSNRSSLSRSCCQIHFFQGMQGM